MFLILFRFRPNAVKSIIQAILNEELSGKQYDAEQTPVWSRSIADKIKHRIKGYSNHIIHVNKLSSQFSCFRTKLLQIQNHCTSFNWRAARRRSTNGNQMFVGC